MDRYPIPHPALLLRILKQPLPPAPKRAMIHISEHCNVRCEFCWHHSFLRQDTPAKTRIETSDCIKLIEQLAAMGTKDISLSANGEPTIHPGFAAIVNTIKDAGMRLKVVTNLTVFTPKIAAALKRTDLLIVNLAAFDEDSYRSIYAPNGTLSFKRIIDNIKTLTDLPKKQGPDIKIGYILTKNTLRHIPKAIKIAGSCNVASVRFKFMDPSSFTQSLILDRADREWLRDQIKDLLKTQLPFSTNLKDILGTLTNPPREEKLPEHGRCFVGWLVININENGTVTLCCQNEELIIGNWKEKPLSEIWVGPKAQEYRHSAKTKIDFDNPLWEECRTCYYSDPKHYLRGIRR